jgi:hypothetical protein
MSYNVCDCEEVCLSGEEIIDVGRVKVERMAAQHTNNSLGFFGCK